MDDPLADALKRAAAARSESVNSYAQIVLAAAVDPRFAGDETEQLRERLKRAGLLAEPAVVSHAAPDEAILAQIRRQAARGHRELSTLIIEDRS